MDKNQVKMWVARDENGKLILYNSRPDKWKGLRFWITRSRNDHYIYLSSDLFPSVKWEDAEPTEVVLTLKK